jgi:putative membrane protein
MQTLKRVRRHVPALACAAALTLAGVASAQNQPGAQPGMQNQRGIEAGQAKPRQPITAEQAQVMLKEFASGNQFEIQSAQLAQQNASDPQVKQFAQRLAQDHQTVQQQIQAVAQQMNVQIGSDLMPAHQAMLDELKQKQGDQFDRAYTFGQVGHHIKDLLMLSFLAQQQDQPQLANLARGAVGPIRMHLQEGQQVATSLITGNGDGARPAGMQTRPDMNTPGAGDRGAPATQDRPGTGTGTGPGTSPPR